MLGSGFIKIINSSTGTGHMVDCGSISIVRELFINDDTKIWLITDLYGKFFPSEPPSTWLITCIRGLGFHHFKRLFSKNIPPQIQLIILLVGINNKLFPNVVSTGLNCLRNIFSGPIFCCEVQYDKFENSLVTNNIKSINVDLKRIVQELFIPLPHCMIELSRGGSEVNPYYAPDAIHFTRRTAVFVFNHICAYVGMVNF